MEYFIVGLVCVAFIATIGQILCVVFSSTPQTKINNTAIEKKDIMSSQIRKNDIECFPFRCVNNNGIISYYFSKEKADSFYFPTTKEGFRTSRMPITYFLSSFASNGLYKNNDFVKKGEKTILHKLSLTCQSICDKII